MSLNLIRKSNFSSKMKQILILAVVLCVVLGEDVAKKPNRVSNFQNEFELNKLSTVFIVQVYLRLFGALDWVLITRFEMSNERHSVSSRDAMCSENLNKTFEVIQQNQ